MKINPAVTLDPQQVRHRERAAQWIEAMRNDIAALNISSRTPTRRPSKATTGLKSCKRRSLRPSAR